jgi:membrane-bound serine protease (ClpP class)
MKRTLLLALLALAITINAGATVLRVTINDVIHPITEERIGRAIDEAEKTKADAVIIELRTPGGLMDSMRGIVEKILHSSVPVIVYVTPSGGYAASAGFFILEAADVAAMAPGTNTGAAHPVVLGGGEIDEVMKAKMENDAAAFMRTIATTRGRNVAVAESAVRQSKSFTEQEALTQKLIDVVAADTPSLLKSLDGRTLRRFNGTNATLHVAGKPVITYEMTIKERVLTTVLNPNVAFVLLVIGVFALIAEFNHPGAVLPGVTGVVCIALALFAMNVLPTRYAALGLLLLAFTLFALEAKFTSHGVLGTGGIVCMAIGGLLLFDAPIPEMRVKVATAIAVSVPLGAITVFLMMLALRVRRQRVVTGQEGMIGEIGVARTELGPEGKVFVHGELWNAIAKSALPQGTRVRVAAINGLHLLVEPADSIESLPSNTAQRSTGGVS